MSTITVKGARNLRPGDVLVRTGVMVVEVWRDPEGTWLVTDDGDEGYVHREDAAYRVER
jgi:phage repressor protein C with HTH and peptisase S24 domain